jgi:hypothetical protein
VSSITLLLLLIILVLLVWIALLRRRVQPGALPPPPPVSPSASESEPDLGPTSIIHFNAAIAGAIKGFEEYGLSRRADWAPFIGPRAAPRPPILVQRLDTTEPGRDYYYLVPLGTSDDDVTAVARVDGASGKYLECTAFRREEKRSWGMMVAGLRTEASTRRMIAGRTFERPNYQGTFVADSRGVGVHPVFVWKPCVESRSPFFPFRLVTIGEQRRYIRIDGTEFESLTDLGPGSLVFKKDRGATSA